MAVKPLIALLLSLFLGAGGHLLVKEGVNRAGSGITAFFHPAVMTGVLCYFLSMVAWLPFLASRPVAKAVPIAGLTYILVALGAGFLKGEWLTIVQWGGVGLISIGVFLLGK